MTCGSCGTENKPGRKFCSACGATLAVGCPSCGAANEPGDAFCGECGSALASRRQPPCRRPPRRPWRERKLVSVLFADLVGFTASRKSRDAEDTRELLSRYFDTCRRLIELYGGTVEKFIGDAVMAVWGTPAATEDDAERAVRAALDLVAAVSALGDELGVPDLRARAGVLTGEAAVTIGAEGEGMVAGDLVNTASRDPGRRRARHGARRRGDAPRDRADGRLRGRRQPRAEGQGRPDPALARAPGRLRRSRHAEVGRARGAVRRPRPRAAPDQGALPRERRREPRAPDLDHRRRRDRQVAAGLGVLQVLRRDRPDHVLAPRPLSLLRRGRHLLGAGGHGADARADRRGRGARPGARQAREVVEEHIDDPEERRSSSRGSRTCSGSRRRAPATSARTCSPPGGCSSSGWPPSTRW